MLITSFASFGSPTQQGTGEVVSDHMVFVVEPNGDGPLKRLTVDYREDRSRLETERGDVAQLIGVAAVDASQLYGQAHFDVG